MYKVACIGDCYLVVSGAPIRNHKMHALQITKMAVDYLNSTKDYPVPHIPGENLQVRIYVFLCNIIYTGHLKRQVK